MDVNTGFQGFLTVTSREMIKPSSPTPKHLTDLKLSFIDQYIHPTFYIRQLHFYSAQGDVNRFENTNTSERLKKSLSETLTEFYPLAGKLDGNNQSIVCSDDGVEYIEARVKAPLPLSQVLKCPKAEELNRLLPYTNVTEFMGLAAVQVTVFDQCGGMAIGISMSHILGDASSGVVFANSWASRARGDAAGVSPKFGFSSWLFPPRDEKMPVGVPRPLQTLVTQRFVFHPSKLEALKAECAAAEQCPTRVEAVSALVFRCLINIAMPRFPKSICLIMPLNMRNRMSPPLPAYYFGNLSTSCTTDATGPKSLHQLVGELRKTIGEYNSDYIEKIRADDSALLHDYFTQRRRARMDNDICCFVLSSMCRFPYYDADFGWGKPAWVATYQSNFKNAISLMDSNVGGAIEAWVSLNEEDMAIFESDAELLEFACANPEVHLQETDHHQ